jgi:hypothetical protein
VAKHTRDATLILHIGLHKTATSYVQNAFSLRRYDLLGEGLLYPTTGATDGVTVSTREGAQSGHSLFYWAEDRRALATRLMAELPDSVSTVLLSSEDFSLPRPRPTPVQFLSGFSAFGTVKVVVVLRRQDVWIESYYKQVVDQYDNFETRPFDEFLRQMGPRLLDFYTRLSPWRDLVGPENFHVMSYDDEVDGASIYRRILEVAGIGGHLAELSPSPAVPRYESVRAIDTLGLRILNSYRLPSRDLRIGIAKRIYAAAPAGDIELMTTEMRDGIRALCDPINERIETEWFKDAVPGLRFGSRVDGPSSGPPSVPELIDYIDQVIALCESAGRTLRESSG